MDLDDELAVELVRQCQEFCENMSQKCSQFLYNYYKEKAEAKTKKQQKQKKIKLKKFNSNNYSNNEEENIEITHQPEIVQDLKPPRKPISAFFRFFSDVQQTYQLQNKEATASEICKIVSQQWAQMSEKEKKPYYDKYIEDVQAYQQQKKQYLDYQDQKNQEKYEKIRELKQEY